MTDKKSKSRNKDKDAQRNEANAAANKASNVATLNKGNKMADLPSVIEFDEDISQAEAPVPLPAGDYPAEIRGATRKTSATSGKEYAATQFFISADSYPADYTEGEPDGTILTFNRVSLENTPASRYRLRTFLESVGAPAGNKIDLNDWVGRTATVTVEHEEYEGVNRAVIKKVSAA